jgi:beta-lactamase regulating signal transducer with metallopeptidase domain
MYSDLYLRLASLLCTYFVQVAVVYLGCLGLSRLIPGPRWRFILWQAFIAGAGLYWVIIVGQVSRLHSQNAFANTYPLGSRFPALQIPNMFAHTVIVAGTALSWVYGACVLLFLISLGLGHVRVWRTLLHGSEADTDLASLFSRVRGALGIHNCDLLMLPGLESPATTGLWKPKIILPAESDLLQDPEVLTDVLSHELAHVARRDYQFAFLSDLVRCLVFFHPAVWLSRNELRLQRELACDEIVVAERPDRRADYAECLTRFARFKMLQDGSPAGIDFAASASFLAVRINSILQAPQPRGFWKTCIRAAAGSFVLGLLSLAWPHLSVAIALSSSSSSVQRDFPALSRSSAKIRLRSVKHPNGTIKRAMVQTNVKASVESSVLESRQTADHTELISPLAMGSDSQPQVIDSKDPALYNPDAQVWGESIPNASATPKQSLSQRVLTTVGQVAGPRERADDGRRDRHFTAPPSQP